jgi:hypothetical protein
MLTLHAIKRYRLALIEWDTKYQIIIQSNEST